MGNREDIKARVDKSILQRFKPSKHQKAYRLEKKNKKRCYAR